MTAACERFCVDSNSDMRRWHGLYVVREPLLDMRLVQGHKDYNEGWINGLK